ncbi:MAG: GNAT family N-acetyltransferase [Candidatus Woesebacteria bacterium]
MSHFIPGKIVKEFTTKSGKQAIIRYPKWEDIEAMTAYMNTLSTENTFVSFSGEELSLKEEAEYLGSMFASMELGDVVKLFCEVENKIVGISDVRRDVSKRERAKHVVIFGITVAKDFRGDGVGKILAQTVFSEAKQMIPGLKIIWLHCFASNTNALALYEKLGFREVGRIPGELLYKSEYIDGVQMTLSV